MNLSILSDNKVDIRIDSIYDNLWMIVDYHLPAEVTHRITVTFDIDGKGYTWSQFFNEKVADFCYMTHCAAAIVKNTLKKISLKSESENG